MRKGFRAGSRLLLRKLDKLTWSLTFESDCWYVCLWSILSLILFLATIRFCVGDWTGDVLPYWPLHSPLVVLLPGHRCLSLIHTCSSHTNLEYPTPAGGLHDTPRYCYPPLPPTLRKRLRGVTVLNKHRGRCATICTRWRIARSQLTHEITTFLLNSLCLQGWASGHIEGEGERNAFIRN